MRAAVIGPGGIGAEVVTALRKRGHDVVVGQRTEKSTVDDTVDAPVVPVDVTDPASCKEFFATVWRDGPVGAVVNCFGVQGDGALLRMPREQAEELHAVNLTGVANVCRAAAFKMMKAGGGTFVNIGSAVSEVGMAGLTMYSASKGALVSFGRALAAELAAYRITCNTVLPGFLDCGPTAERSAAWKEAVARHVPLGRLGTAAEVAALVANLVEPESRYITGQQFVIDGGWTLGSPALAKDLAALDG